MAGRTPYPQEMKERAVRMVGEIRENYGNEYAAIRAVAARLGIGSPETVRKWLRRAQVDAGERPGITSEEKAEIRALKQEVADVSQRIAGRRAVIRRDSRRWPLGYGSTRSVRPAFLRSAGLGRNVRICRDVSTGRCRCSRTE